MIIRVISNLICCISLLLIMIGARGINKQLRIIILETKLNDYFKILEATFFQTYHKYSWIKYLILYSITFCISIILGHNC